jgi:hypothetical protein
MALFLLSPLDPARVRAASNTGLTAGGIGLFRRGLTSFAFVMKKG